MKAKCPHCTSGCDRCDHTGFITVKFAQGDLYTRACTTFECGFENGGLISKTTPTHDSGPCLRCKGPTKWQLIAKENELA